MVTIGPGTHVVAAIEGSDFSFTVREEVVSGEAGAGETALALPALIDSGVRRWSSVLTLDRLLPGATAGSGSLKEAIADVKEEIRMVCAGSLPLGDLPRTDTTIGAAFVPLAEGHLPHPYGALRAAMRRGRIPLELT